MAASEASATSVQGLDDERAPSLQDERAALIEARDPQPESWMQQHRLADLAALPLGVDARSVAHPATGEAFTG
jgi:hypothetical protein